MSFKEWVEKNYWEGYLTDCSDEDYERLEQEYEVYKNGKC